MKQNVMNFIVSFGGIVDNVITIATFGYYVSTFELSVMWYLLDKEDSKVHNVN